MTLTVAELAKRIGAELVGDPNLPISSVHTLEEAEPGQVSFIANKKYEPLLATTRASAVIVSPKVTSDRVTLLKARDPYYALMQAVVALHGYREHPHAGIHPKAHVEPTATVGAGTVVYPGVYVGPRAKIGRDCILYPNAVVYDDCVLGDRVILQAGAVIGCDGYGFSTHQGVHHKIPQIGIVILEDDVEIGSNTCVARAAMGCTLVGKGTKIDNSVAVGHGVKIGPHGLVVSQVGIAGSTKIGHHVTIGGQVGIAGHLTLGDQVTLAAMAGVYSDIESGAVMFGAPAMPIKQGRRAMMLVTQLPEILDRIRELERRSGKTTPETESE